MATGSALNLSLLSRGIGEVKRNGTEKVDVIFEPQDYFNFVEESHERPFFLPPLQPRYGFASEPSQLSSRFSSKDAVHLPKTFTTRKGALLLFSEDMAHKMKPAESKKHKNAHGYHSDRDITMTTLESTASDRDLKTVDDLAKSILAYGSIDESGNMDLKVMIQKKKRRYDYERQIRPGFSAKRYLSTWTKTWDDNTLEKVISKGYLTEKSLFYYNPLLPHLSRRLNDDLSHYPTPYKLMRSMLMSPGSLSGYTFYRVRPESQETDYFDMEDEDDLRAMSRSRQAGSVKVASVLADGQIKEAIYGQLDRQAQAEVLTDLLVKGAVHYAMKTQQEYADRIIEEGGEDVRMVPRFDMREAVETMLQDNEKRGVPSQILEPELPEREDGSQHSGSFKGGKLGQHRHGKDRGHGEGVHWRDDVSSASSGGAPGPLPTSHAPLPPIGQTYTQLTPIGEASREHTQAFSLPVNEKDDEEEEGWAGRGVVERNVEPKGHRVPEVIEDRRKLDMDKRKARVSAKSLDLEGPSGANILSSSESIGPGSTHSSGWLPPVHKQQWKGSQQSLRSHGSRRPSGSIVDGDAGSTKGSIIYGPDGSVIKVGETVKLSARASQQSVHDMQDILHHGLIDASDDSDAEVPDEWRKFQSTGRKSEAKKLPKRESPVIQPPKVLITVTGCESPRPNVTEQEIIDKLTQHATHIAESVLSHSDSGRMLEEDIRRAAALWMETHPARNISRSQSVQDLPDNTVIQEVMKVQKRNSAGPTVAEYRDQIRGNLMTALAKATGLKQSDIPQDAEIDPDLLEQLASNTLTPEDIEIVRDDETGRSFIRSRNRVISEAMGGVEKGHIYQPAAKNGEAGKRISIPSERKPADLGELDIVNYQGQPEEEKTSPKASKPASEVGSKKAKSLKSGSVKEADAKSTKSGVSFKDDQGQEDLQKALAELEQGGSPTDAVSVSGKSGKSDKKSKVSDKKAPSPEKEKKEEFVVGKPKEKKAPAKAPAGKKKTEKGGKKGKGKGKKKEEPAEVPTAVEAVSPSKEPTIEPPREKTPKPESPISDRTESKHESEDDDEEYIIVRDETMSPQQEVPDVHLNITTSAEEEEPDEEQDIPEDLEDMSEADKQRMISNREARAAKRAAAAEKRRQEVERKRKEREEQIKREKEEHERQEVLKQEQEELRKQKEEERRLKKQKEEEENEEAMKEELERQRREKAEAEKERRRKEEYAKKLEMMKAKQAEEEKKRQEEAERKRLEEEERRKEEEEMMAKMAEEERLEYERKKKEEELERLRKEEEDKKRREEEAQRALEEARRLAEEMARKQAELEARLRFNRSLQMESNGLEHTQDITKAFVFSYFELLQWLGLDIPEFELLKLNQY